MRFAILRLDWDTSPKQFVAVWSTLYSYPQEHLYSASIGKNELTVDDVNRLFEWKNGTRLSTKKAQSLRKITDEIQIINQLKSEPNLRKFLREFSNVTAIWKIFLLHIIAPQTYPIFDQHVFRAFHFLQSNDVTEIPSTNSKKERIYFQDYLQFFNDLANDSNMPRKKVDEALWVFGKFLKTAYGSIACR